MSEYTLETLAKLLVSQHAETTAAIAQLKAGQEVLTETVQALATHVDTSIAESEYRMKDFVERRVTAAVEEIAPTMRKIDAKDTALVEQLEEKSVISPKESANITALSPFPAV